MKSLRTLTLLLFAVTSLTVLYTIAEEVTPQRLALRQLVQRSQDGDSEALYRLAYLHDIGYDSIPIDTARSTQLYLQSAEKGNVKALNYLGFRYYNGDGVERDVTRGLHYIQKATESGDAHAASNMGFLLLKGDGIEHDLQRAAYWLQKGADGNVGTAQAMLADLLSDGMSLPADTLQAAELYTKAIENGVPDVQGRLMNIMRKRWLQLPQDSIVDTGIYYYTHRAPHIGVDLFQTAADSLNPQALALLGDAYTRGFGTDYDYNRSLQYFLKAALLGNPSAQFFIGETLQIFPDALQDIIAEITGKKSDKPADNTPYTDSLYHHIIQSIPSADLNNAEYWLQRAASQDIHTAESASLHLFE